MEGKLNGRYREPKETLEAREAEREEARKRFEAKSPEQREKDVSEALKMVLGLRSSYEQR